MNRPASRFGSIGTGSRLYHNGSGAESLDLPGIHGSKLAPTSKLGGSSNREKRERSQFLNAFFMVRIV
jgi:hypothetical protein